MSKDKCQSHLESALNCIQNMQEILDGSDGLQAFIEAYAEASDQLLEAVSAAMLAAIPK